MAFEMESSSTANAAKLAVLWRDKDKKGSGGSGGSVPDHFVEDVFEGGILDTVIPPPPGPATTNSDGSVTPGIAPTPTLVDHKTIYTDSQKLKSLFAVVQDLRAVVVSPAGFGAPLPTEPLSPLTDGENDGPFFGPDLKTTFSDVRALTVGTRRQRGPNGLARPDVILRDAAASGDLRSILDIVVDIRSSLYGGFGPVLSQTASGWMTEEGLEEDIPFVHLSFVHALRQIVSRLDQLEVQVRSLQEAPT